MARKFKKNDVVRVDNCRYRYSWGIVVGWHKAALGGINDKPSNVYDLNIIELNDENPQLDPWPDISFLAKELIKIDVPEEIIKRKIMSLEILQGKYR